MTTYLIETKEKEIWTRQYKIEASNLESVQRIFNDPVMRPDPIDGETEDCEIISINITRESDL